MKKISFYAAVALLGFLASCNKQLENSVSVPDNEGTKVLLTVKDAEWTGDDTKTAYAPGTGVGLSGDELISLYYSTVESETTKFWGNIKAEPVGGGDYTFTISGDAEGKTHWYGLMPYSSQVNAFNGSHTSVNLRLGPVQFPGANTFDPHADYMVARPFDVAGVAGEETGEIASFKRIFAPLCIAVTGLEAGDKIYTATLSFSQAPAADNALIGMFYVMMNDSYDANTVSVGASAAGNALTAEYANGLEAVGDNWPVWLVVNPITLEAGGTLTLCISTTTKTYTRTVTLPASATLSAYQLNRIPFNIKGSGYTEVESVTQDFTEQPLIGNDSLTASDGSSLSWSSSLTRDFSSYDDNDSGITGAMYANKAFTFPAIPGKKIIGARIFTHPASRSGGNSSTSTLTVDGADVYPFNLVSFVENDGMFFKGGALDIALPEGKTTLSGITVTPTAQQNLISAITLFTEDDPAFANDYYAQYEAGRDIEINGTVFNKATNGDARLIKLYNQANANAVLADYTENGILFLDYDEADGATDELDFSSYWAKPTKVVIIGRYRNHQPRLITKMQPKGPEMFLKNVELSLAGPVYTAEVVSTLDFNAEDCTIVAGNNQLFCENKTGVGFRNIVINNSIIKLVRSLYEVQGTTYIASGSNLLLEKLHITNSVVYAASAVNYPTVNLRPNSTTVWYTPYLDLNFRYNTFYNLANPNALGMVALGNMTKLNIFFCVGDATLSRETPVVQLAATLSPQVEDSAIRRNQFNDRGATYNWKYYYSTVGNSGVKASAFVATKGVSPFVSVDTATGYFPIDGSVVTGDVEGAGASYTNKYWKNWGE